MPDFGAAVVLTGVGVIAFVVGVRAAPLLGGCAVTVLLLALVLLDTEDLVPWALVTLGPWGAGWLVGSRRQLVDSLAERTRALEAERDECARLAVQRERARIAHELHDVVSHHLAVIVIHAGAGRVAGPGDPRSEERFVTIRRSGEEALADVRRLVALLAATDGRSAPAGALGLLLAQARTAGLRIDAGAPPADATLSAEVEATAYRVVQEGLTNAMKHAPGSDVRVRIRLDGEVLHVELDDSGARAPATLAASGSGTGLAGLRQRVEALGGCFEAGARPEGGWRVRAAIPSAA